MNENKNERIKFWEFEDGRDRDSTAVIVIASLLLGGALYLFRDEVAKDSTILIAVVVGLTNSFALIINAFFQRDKKNGNGAPPPIDVVKLIEAANKPQLPPAPCESVEKEQPKERPKEDKPKVNAPITAPAPINSDEIPQWLLNARKYVDQVSESTPEGGKTIQRWAKSIGFSIPDTGEIAWCAIFLGSQLLAAGYKPLKTMRARDYATYGAECDPKPGAIFVAQSHAAFVDRIDDNGEVYLLGGNQSDKVCIQPAKYYGTPLAYRWPVEQNTA